MSASSDRIMPQPDVLNAQEYGKFVLTNLAAKRAKQLKEGAPPLVRIESNHPLTIALAEIAAGKIKPILGAEGARPTEIPDLAAFESEELIDVGLLLPALDDEEAQAIAVTPLLDDDFDIDHFDEDDEEVAVAHEVGADADPDESLAGLLGEEDESEHEAVLDADGDEISLDDLAEEEEGQAGDEETPEA